MCIEIRHGWLRNAVGSPLHSEGIWFVTVRGDIDDPKDSQTYPLADISIVTVDVDGFQLGDADGPWVRSAIQSAFKFSPLLVADGRWFVCNSVFMAIIRQSEECLVAYPFVCTDAGYSTSLVFSLLGPSSELRERISTTFWSVLLAKAAVALSDFMASGVQLDTVDGYDTELVVGYSQGQFYAEELRYHECNEQTLSEFDSHAVWLCRETPVCPDCSGSGEESFLPAGESCDICGGTGRLR